MARDVAGVTARERLTLRPLRRPFGSGSARLTVSDTGMEPIVAGC